MPENWTGDVVGRMHLLKITNRALAAQLGCTEEYVSMILNGKRNPKKAEEIFRKALDELSQKRKED